MLFETSVWPVDIGQWLAIAALGLMPVGAAFYVWDHGVKHGDIQLLGASSYLGPLLSTLILILAGFASFTASIALAAILIAGGAALASSGMFTRRPPRGSAVVDTPANRG